MLIKKVTYTDYNGNPQTDTLYFNLTKTEVAAMQVRMDGKFLDYLQDLIAGDHFEKLFEIFRDLVLDSYGEKSEDGKKFRKTPGMRREFEDSLAFDTVFSELMSDIEKTRLFSQAILPPDYQSITTNNGMIDASVADNPA